MESRPKRGAKKKIKRKETKEIKIKEIREKLASPHAKQIKRLAKEIESTYPIVDAECPKCGNKTAYWWMQQILSGEDEPETQFFRCTKCKHTWRKSG
ncbi:MAG: RPA12/RPB9/RPC11 RNA polymerase family protein [Candidatus Nanoarchaeia archaeon]